MREIGARRPTVGRFHPRRRGAVAVFGATALCLVLVGWSAAPDPGRSAGAAPGGIIQAMPSTALGSGHFADPYPIDVTRGADGSPLTAFSSTFNELAICRGAITARCFSASQLVVTYSAALRAELKENGDSPVAQANHNIFHMSDGRWEMALSLEIERGSSTWKLDLNAQPVGDAQTDGVPTRWVAGSILVGSPTTPAQANYDAKYLDADGSLHLVYSRNLSGPPVGRDGLVAQRMMSPTQPARSAPVTLLAPGDSAGGLESERADAAAPNDRFALVETGNITKIGSVWVLVYSTGTVDHANYKIGVAYADSPVPQGGYRKVLVPDPRRVWGSSGDEVDYLLQAQKPDWPHYVGRAVQAPGVGSIVERDGGWYLFFAADSSTQRTTGRGTLDPHLRNFYFVKLVVAVPHVDRAVAHATGSQLATWITPVLNH